MMRTVRAFRDRLMVTDPGTNKNAPRANSWGVCVRNQPRNLSNHIATVTSRRRGLIRENPGKVKPHSE